MTAEIAKETIYKQDFQNSLENANQPEWLKDLREKAFSYFTEKGFPTVKNEEWKYTNVAAVDSGQWTVVSGQKDEISGSAAEFLKQFNFERNGFTALNLAFADVVVVKIPKETVIEKPFEFNFKADENSANFPHIVVMAEAGSKATIIENYESDFRSFTNSAIQIFVEDNANLTHYRVQKESADSLNIGTSEITLGRGSLYNSTNINLGAKLSRHDIHLKFTAPGGEAFVDGLYLIGDEQHHDTHSVIDHALPNCISHQTYKGIVDGKARAVFNGKIFVRENASGTDGYQSNKNLLLSNEARVDTKPQLEIYNDDVKCAHGATVGQLEEEELFYLLSRGLNETLARNLLTYGFAEEIVNKIGIESIKKQLDEAVLNRLNANLEM